MNRTSLGALRPMLLVFIFLNAFLFAGKTWLAKKGIDQGVVLVGNLVLFVVLLFSFLLTQRSLAAANPNVFVRAVYASFIIKFFVIAIGAFVYIQVAKQDVNKPALIICMGLYILYTFFEVSTLLRLLKQKKNA
ncbi:MAG TPA: hypothetical protein VK666_14325 [Chryseolinea sp.]|jgi:hypothetical protein|nr:hypothetical protein [Chryseolinea sp.]